MSDFNVRCPHCGTNIRFTSDKVGHTANCPNPKCRLPFSYLPAGFDLPPRSSEEDEEGEEQREGEGDEPPNLPRRAVASLRGAFAGLFRGLASWLSFRRT